MSLLHIINKSPFDRNSLGTCVDLSLAGSAIILIEDAVVAARQGTTFEAMVKDTMGNRKVYALGPDLDARGIDPSKIIDGIEVVDYAGFVNLTTTHDSLQSWL